MPYIKQQEEQDDLAIAPLSSASNGLSRSKMAKQFEYF